MSTSNVPTDPPHPCDLSPLCPICSTQSMTLARETRDMVICVCLECGTTLSVPPQALSLYRKVRRSAQT